MQVEGQRGWQHLAATGARVRNAYGTCPPQGDSPSKGGSIPHGPYGPHGLLGKDLSAVDGHACH